VELLEGSKGSIEATVLQCRFYRKLRQAISGSEEIGENDLRFASPVHVALGSMPEKSQDNLEAGELSRDGKGVLWEERDPKIVENQVAKFYHLYVASCEYCGLRIVPDGD
jgi:hypothetical protein